MKDLSIIKETMSSIEIAELTGKMHKHVLEAIRVMEPSWEKVAGTKFRLGTYKDANQQDRPCYELTKIECLYIATKLHEGMKGTMADYRIGSVVETPIIDVYPYTSDK